MKIYVYVIIYALSVIATILCLDSQRQPSRDPSLEAYEAQERVNIQLNKKIYLLMEYEKWEIEEGYQHALKVINWKQERRNL